MSWHALIPIAAIALIAIALVMEVILKRGRSRPLSATKPDARRVSRNFHNATLGTVDVTRSNAQLNRAALQELKDAERHRQSHADATCARRKQKKLDRVRPWNTNETPAGK